MPNAPRRENRHRMVRVEDDLWDEAKRKALAEGTTVSAVIRSALQRFVGRTVITHDIECDLHLLGAPVLDDGFVYRTCERCGRVEVVSSRAES